MAKIVATFDTVSKSFKITKDGDELKNITGVGFYPSYKDDAEDCMCCQISMAQVDEEEGIRMYQSLSASAAKEGFELVDVGNKGLSDAVKFLSAKRE